MKTLRSSFPSRKGRDHDPLSRVQAYRILSEAAKEIGIKEAIGTHILLLITKRWRFYKIMFNKS